MHVKGKQGQKKRQDQIRNKGHMLETTPDRTQLPTNRNQQR